MSFDAQTLYRLLPAIHRIRDANLAQAAGIERGPAEDLLAVLAEEIGILEENLEQLYDDLFIETCADWVVPYIGDLIGYESLHGVAPRIIASPRAEVAHTIALRRRKGTALVLEQLARDVTGWNARAVEFFQCLATTQYLNHPRLHSRRCPDVRDAAAMEWIGTAFESVSRSVDVRSIESGRGRHNIPNVGLFLWRLQAYRHSDSPAVQAGERRYRISPLNHDVPLYNYPQPEDTISHLAEPNNVPWPLTRRRLARHLDDYYGMRPTDGAEVDNPEPSLMLSVNGTVIERDRIVVCDLSDDGAGWAHTPRADDRYAIDPALGRIALPPQEPDPADVQVTWHEGFSADLGGGEYERGTTLRAPEAQVTVVRVPEDQPTLTQALADLAGDGVVEITDNGRYVENLAIQVNAASRIELRAINGRRPVVVLNAPMTVSGGARSRFVLNGLLITGDRLEVPNTAGNALSNLEIIHSTLVPGLAIEPNAQPQQPDEPSLLVEIPNLEVSILRAILGNIRLPNQAALSSATDSIIDATARDGVAFAAPDGISPGGRFSLESCTVIGKIHASEFGVVSNSILLAEGTLSPSWAVPVRAERTQVGCVRFSYLPYSATVPRRYRCQPELAGAVQLGTPRFTSLRYGTPAYCQLAASTPVAIRQGTEEESEMGVFRHLYSAQRETNLRIRLGEYLRVGLRAGIFFES